MKQREISFQHAVVLGYSEKILVLSVIGSSRYPKTLLTRTNCFHDSFLISIVNLRNCLPDVIQDTDSLLSLKNRLKNIVPVCIRLWCREHPDRQDAAVLILRRRARANPFFFFFFFFDDLWAGSGLRLLANVKLNIDKKKYLSIYLTGMNTWPPRPTNTAS